MAYFWPFFGGELRETRTYTWGTPSLLTRSPTHNGGRLARWSNRDQSAQRLFYLYIYFLFCLIFFVLRSSHDVRHRTQSLDALSSEIAWAYPRKSRSSLSCK